MAFSKPIGYIPGSAIRRGRTEKQIEKIGKIRWHFIDILVPHIQRFVRDSYNENFTPEQRLADDRETNQKVLEYLKSERGRVEVGELEGEEKKFFEEMLRSTENTAVKSDEELERERKEIDEEIVAEFTCESADEIWRMAINALHRLWKKGGSQSVVVKELIAGLDFARYLADKISAKYYPEMKDIVVSLVSGLFKESHMDTTRSGYVEMAYLESSGQIVLREVSWEMLQTWANS